MEITLPKLAMTAAALLAISGGAGWAYATATMKGRLASVRNESMQIGYAQGGRLPTERQVRTQVEGIAAAHQVELGSLTVHAHDEQGLGRVTSLAPQLATGLTGTLRVFDIRATGTTHALLWSITEPIEVDLNLRTSVSIRGPERGRTGAGTGRPTISTPGVSTDVHGGQGLSDYAIER